MLLLFFNSANFTLYSPFANRGCTSLASSRTGVRMILTLYASHRLLKSREFTFRLGSDRKLVGV